MDNDSSRRFKIGGGLVLLTLALCARPASAASVNDFYLGPELGGPQQGTFGPNTVIHFSGKNRFINACREMEGVNDFVYPAGDVYVIAGGSTPGSGAKLKDAGGAPSTVIETTTAGFQDEILSITVPGGKLDAGTYSVVFDACQDGKFTPQEDDFWPDAITVELPAVLPAIAPYIADVKYAALSESEHWQQIQNAFHRMLAASEYVENSACLFGDFDACLGLIQTIADDPAVQDYLEDVGKLAEAAECAGDAGACIGLINDLLVTPPNISSSPRDVVLGGFKNQLANQVKSYFSVYLDPPRDDFGLVASPVVPWVFEQQPGGSRFLASVATANPAIERQQALLAAFLTALERYQGAQRAGRAAEALARVEEARGLAAALSAGLPSVLTRLEAIGPALLEDVPDIEAAFQKASASHARVSAGGFSADELRVLRNMGLGDAEIDAAFARVSSYSSSDLYNPSVAAWDASVAALVQQAEDSGKAFDDAVSSLGELADQLRADQAAADAAVPVISIAGPGLGEVGEELTLTAQAPAGVTLEWDLQALGAFQDGTGATVKVTYRLPGERVVSVRATGVGRVPVAATALLDIADGNAPPVLASPLPAPVVQWVPSGQPLAFSVVPSDPDGDAVTVTWQLDGADVATGNAWQHTFDAAAWGQHRVQAIGRDGQRGHEVTRDFLVQVQGPDADRDGWSSTPKGDCDDADPSVNPSRIERPLNGKDDDCDPATLDTIPASAGGDVAGGELLVWGDTLSSDVSNGTPQAVTGVGDVLQVETALASAWALRSDGTLAYYTPNGGVCPVAGVGSSSCPAGVSSVAGVGGAALLTGVTSIDYDDYTESAAALRQDGSVVAWGSNGAGQTGTGSSAQLLYRPETVVRADNQQPLTGLRAVEVGTFNNWGLMPNGDVWAWGSRTGNICLGPNAYSTVTTTLAFPVPVVGKAMQVSDSIQRVIFLRPDGSVSTCDIGKSNPALLPLDVAGFGVGAPLGKAVQVLTSNASFWVVNDRGELYGWGQQVGGGFRVFGEPGPTPVPPFTDAGATTIAEPTLAPLPAGPPVAWIAGGGDTMHVVRADGSVVIWGGTTHHANGAATNQSAVLPTTLGLGAGTVLASDASSWTGAAIRIPGSAIAPDWNPPKQWASVFAGPAVGIASGDEGSELGVPLRLSHALDVPVKVTWSFDGQNGETSFAAGATTAEALVTLPHDGLDGPTSTATLTISSVDSGVRVGRRSTEVEVTNIDSPPTLSVGPAVVEEGDTSLSDWTLTLTLSQPSGWDTRARLATEGVTALAGVDYLSSDVLVPFAAGQTSQKVHLTGIGNALVEADRQLTLTLSGETHLPADPVTAPLTIHDDDPVQLLVSSDSVKAGEVASVSISAPELLAGESVELQFETVDGSAVAGTDFEGAKGNVTLTREESATIAVQTSQSAGSSAPQLASLQFYVRMTPREGERAVLSPPLATVGVQVEPRGEGGAPAVGEGDAGAPQAGSPDAAAGHGGAPEVEGRAASRDDGGCGCVVGRRAPAHTLYGALALAFRLIRRRRPRSR
jgi:hypothetical protein